MRTVKEISEITGISVRALHYYDEIGLLKPTGKTEAGYRLYDDTALAALRQILFFREFDLPLREIKAILEDPSFSREEVLRTQRRMLRAKEERIRRLIRSIDDILKGEEAMDFAVFTKTELEELFQATVRNMPEELRRTALEEFGSLENWREHYLGAVSAPKFQESYRKMVEWYGGKEGYLSSAKNPVSREVAEAFQKREEAILAKLAAKRDCPPDSFPVREIVGEYGFVMKQLFQLKDEGGMMLSLAQSLRNDRTRPGLEEKYGEGVAEFFARAIEGFYGSSD